MTTITLSIVFMNKPLLEKVTGTDEQSSTLPGFGAGPLDRRSRGSAGHGRRLKLELCVLRWRRLEAIKPRMVQSVDYLDALFICSAHSRFVAIAGATLTCLKILKHAASP